MKKMLLLSTTALLLVACGNDKAEDEEQTTVAQETTSAQIVQKDESKAEETTKESKVVKENKDTVSTKDEEETTSKAEVEQANETNTYENKIVETSEHTSSGEETNESKADLDLNRKNSDSSASKTNKSTRSKKTSGSKSSNSSSSKTASKQNKANKSESSSKSSKPAKKPSKPAETSVVLGVPFISQYEANAPMGCEAGALLQALHYKGYATNYNLATFLSEMPISKDKNPNNGFSNSPYDTGEGYHSIFASPLASWGSRYGNVSNISGTSASGLKDEIRKGNPVIVYVTSHFAQTPKWKTYEWGTGLTNAHIMTLDGFKGDKYHVVDPAAQNGSAYWVSAKTFETAYNFTQGAVAVR